MFVCVSVGLTAQTLFFTKRQPPIVDGSNKGVRTVCVSVCVSVFEWQSGYVYGTIACV